MYDSNIVAIAFALEFSSALSAMVDVNGHFFQHNQPAESRSRRNIHLFSHGIAPIKKPPPSQVIPGAPEGLQKGLTGAVFMVISQI